MPSIKEYFPGIKDGIVTLEGLQVADLGDVLDANGNEVLEFDAIASAVNHVGVQNAATGGNPTIYASGEADTGLTFENSEGEEILILDSIASSVNELTIKSAATGNNPIVAATGEADTGITFENDQSEEILILNSVATSVNELTIASAATGNNPTIAATGEADTGITFNNDQAEEILILDSNATAVNEVTIDNAATGGGPSISATGDDSNINLELIPKGTGTVNVDSADNLTVNSVIVPQELEVTYYDDANGDLADQAFFVATQAYQVTKVSEVHSTAGSDGGAVNLQVTKDESTDAPGAGTDLLTDNSAAGFDLKGTANTVQNGSLSVTESELQLAAGDRLSVDYAGTLTAVTGVCVTVTLKRI